MLKPKKKGIFSKYRLLWIWGAIISNVAFIAAFLIVAILFVVCVGGFFAFKFVEQPGFCGNVCHAPMNESYKEWKNDSHEGIECAHCHNDPGFMGFVEGTIWGAIWESYLFVTGNYGHHPILINMENHNCLRHGCHKEERLLEEESLFKGVYFDHNSHLENIEHNKSLHCTSCHGGMIEGKHVAVSEDICYLCHMKKSSLGVKRLSCADCHGEVPRSEDFDHAEEAEGADCTDCHDGFGPHKSGILFGQCRICHAEEAEDFGHDADPAELHQLHVRENIVQCFFCHDRVPHGEE